MDSWLEGLNVSFVTAELTLQMTPFWISSRLYDSLYAFSKGSLKCYRSHHIPAEVLEGSL